MLFRSGFVERVFGRFEEILAAALRLVRECPCETGCPSCVGLPVLRPALHHDPDTHAGWPIPSKDAAGLLLALLLATGGGGIPEPESVAVFPAPPIALERGGG